MKTNLLALAAIITLISSSCSTQTTEPAARSSNPKTVEDALILTTVDAKGVFDVFVTRAASSSAVGAYGARGLVYDSIGATPLTLVSGGTAVMAGCTLALQTSYGNGYLYHPYETGGTAPSFGGTKSFSTTGNSSEQINAFSMSFYVPTEITLNSPSTPMSSVSSGSGFTVTWNTDNSNNNGVYIGLVYLGLESNAENSSLSATDVYKLISTTDDGSHTISSSDLANMPVGGILKVVIGRGASNSTTVGGQIYIVNAYSLASTRYRISS
jgi:hypothetical protein